MPEQIEPQTPGVAPDLKFELSDHLPFLFKHVHSQLEAVSGAQPSKFGAHVAWWRILAVLWAHDSLSHRELATLTSIEVAPGDVRGLSPAAPRRAKLIPYGPALHASDGGDLVGSTPPDERSAGRLQIR
jgi:hypothetical protein